LKNEGIRLIDVGISAFKRQLGEVIFDKYVEFEKEVMILFREYFITS